jgi:hypothetical protein
MFYVHLVEVCELKNGRKVEGVEEFFVYFQGKMEALQAKPTKVCLRLFINSLTGLDKF